MTPNYSLIFSLGSFAFCYLLFSQLLWSASTHINSLLMFLRHHLFFLPFISLEHWILSKASIHQQLSPFYPYVLLPFISSKVCVPFTQLCLLTPFCQSFPCPLSPSFLWFPSPSYSLNTYVPHFFNVPAYAPPPTSKPLVHLNPSVTFNYLVPFVDYIVCLK